MAFVKGQGLMDDKFKNLDEEQQARAEAHMASRRGVRRASFAGIPQTSVLKRASEQVKASKLTPLLLWTKLSIRYGGVEKAAVAGAQGSVQRGTFTALLKERKAGLYSTAAWYCAYMSVETFIITNCSLSCGILYAQLMGFVRCWSVAVRPFGLQILCQLKFAVYFGAICNGLSLLFSQILMLSVAITRNLNAAFIIAMGVFIQGFITSGFPVDLTSMNPDATWLQYTCASAASPVLSVVPRKKTLVPPPRSVFHYPYDACQRMLLGDDYAADQGFVWPKRSAIAFDLVVMYGAWLFLHIPTFYAFVFWQDRSDENYDPHTRAR